MADIQETIKKDNKKKSNRAQKDLIIIAVITILVFILSYFLNIFYFIIDFLKKYPQNIIYIDEVITVLLTLSISFAVFSWRRWTELEKETAERIKIQEELIRMANTKAETERIISKQLQSEIELRREAERNISSSKPKFKDHFK